MSILFQEWHPKSFLTFSWLKKERGIWSLQDTVNRFSVFISILPHPLPAHTRACAHTHIESKDAFTICNVAKCHKIRLCCTANVKTCVDDVNAAQLWHGFCMRHVAWKFGWQKLSISSKIATPIFAINCNEM